MDQHHVYSIGRIDAIMLVAIAEMVDCADHFADMPGMEQLKSARRVESPPHANTSHSRYHCQKRSPMPCRSRKNVETLPRDDG